jgi:heat shock protein HtpX
MKWTKRIGFFLLTNIAVIAVVSIILSVFNVAPYLTDSGLDYSSLLIFSALFGFTGSLISLFISKWMAKRAFGVQVITSAQSDEEHFLYSTIQRLSERAGIGMPEVGIYDSPEANAFATGWNKNKALVAVSTGLMHNMTRDEVEGVLGHEISHIANGDMVTLALIQGVVNTFVIFFARIVAYAVQTFINRGEEGGIGTLAYHITAIIFEIFFGILASLIVMAFSRHREYRADAGSATLLGKEKMILALEKLARLQETLVDPRGKAFSAMKISDRPSMLALFSSHPPLTNRINALRNTTIA